MTLQEYKKEMGAAFQRNIRNGGVDWSDCPRLLKDVSWELDRVHRELTKKKRYNDLMEFAIYTLKKWKDTPKDDSRGESLEFCYYILEIFDTIYEKGEEEVSHLTMLKKLEAFASGYSLDFFKGEILEYILEHFKTPQELSQKEAFFRKNIDELKKLMTEKNVLHSSIDLAQERLVRVLADQKKPIEEIREILREQDHYVGRQRLADIEKEYGNYEEAIGLYKAVIEERPDSYWSDEPRKALMEIYELQGNQTEYKEELYSQMIAHPEEKSFYKKYKASVTDKEWKEKWEEILEKYKGHYDKIILWLGLEKRYDLVMEAVEPDKSYLLADFEKKLFQLYPERCLKVMEKSAENTASLSNKRSDYRFLVGELRNLASFPGGEEIAIELARRFCEMYPRRRAMLEELDEFLEEMV